MPSCFSSATVSVSAAASVSASALIFHGVTIAMERTRYGQGHRSLHVAALGFPHTSDNEPLQNFLLVRYLHPGHKRLWIHGLQQTPANLGPNGSCDMLRGLACLPGASLLTATTVPDITPAVRDLAAPSPRDREMVRETTRIDFLPPATPTFVTKITSPWSSAWQGRQS
jgi:hypothetical protein